MKRIFAVLVLCCAAHALMGQVSQQVEVTKAYVPHVGQAGKLPVAPRMSDTVALRPDIEYSIVPQTWNTEFETRRISPATVSANPYHLSTPFYIKAAVGYPLQSLLDAHAARNYDGRSTAGAYVKHYGSYSKLRSDYGTSPHRATYLDNEAGVFGSKRLGRYMLDGSLSYANLLAYRYGMFALDSVTVAPGENLIPENVRDRMVDIGTLEGEIRFGDAFTDMSHFNFAAGLEAGFTHDAARDRQVDIDASVRAGRMYGAHGFDVAIGYDGYVGAVALRDASAGTVKLSPRYVLSLPKVSLRVGVDYAYTYDRLYPSRHNIFPALDLRLDVVKGYFIPYITASGEVLSGSYASLCRRNPYLAAGSVAPSGSRIDLRAGIEGSVKGCFLYRAYAGYGSLRRMPFFVSLYMPGWADDTGQFGVFSDDSDAFAAGAELQFRVAERFDADLKFDYYGYDTDALPHGGGMPRLTSELTLRYSYRDKFSVGVSALLLGARYFPEIDARGEQQTVWSGSQFAGDIYTSRVPATVDLRVDADFRISKKLWGFVSGRNLAASRLYAFNHYRQLGVNALVGVKLVF